MRRFYTLSVAVLLTLLAVSCASCKKHGSTPPQTPDSQKEYVVIVSMDAFRHDLPDMYSTPTLDSVARVGVCSQIKPCFPSVTFPNHYAMATGLYPDHNGIVNNSFYDKKMSKPYSITNNTARKNPDFYYGEPIWNTAERQGKRVNVYGWVGVEAKINGRQPTKWVEYDKNRTRRQIADMALEALCNPDQQAIPDLVMFYFDEPDAVEHSYSPSSTQTKAVVEDIDNVLGYFLREVRRSPVYKHINFIFTSDHGMTELSPDRFINIYNLLDNNRIAYCDSGTPLMLEPTDDYVDKAFEILSKEEHLKVYRRESMPERFHYGSCTDRIKPLVVLPDMGWKVVYNKNGYPPTAKSGSHGFDPDGEDMQMVFYGFGPSFKSNYRHGKVFENINDYIIICRLLGIEPAVNDCKWSDVEGLFE